MKRLLALAILLSLLVTFAMSCKDDVIVEPPPSLTGDYQGTYVRQVGQQTPEVENVIWRFTSNGYIMRWDSTAGNETVISCNASGNYTLENNVELEELNSNLDQGVAGGPCDENKTPKGVFGLDRSQEGRVLMRQVLGDTLKEIELFGPQ
jgi:hypothetical protein